MAYKAANIKPVWPDMSLYIVYGWAAYTFCSILTWLYTCFTTLVSIADRLWAGLGWHHYDVQWTLRLQSNSLEHSFKPIFLDNELLTPLLSVPSTQSAPVSSQHQHTLRKIKHMLLKCIPYKYYPTTYVGHSTLGIVFIPKESALCHIG